MKVSYFVNIKILIIRGDSSLIAVCNYLFIFYEINYQKISYCCLKFLRKSIYFLSSLKHLAGCDLNNKQIKSASWELTGKEG